MYSAYSNEGNSNWFGESAGTFVKDLAPGTSSFRTNDEGLSFEDHFEKLYENYNDTLNIDIKKDIKNMVNDVSFMQQYKKELFEPIVQGFLESSDNDPHIRHIIENVESLWDTKVRQYSESAGLADFLPISTLEFPVLTKQFFASITKDIIEVESVKTPQIVKHIKHTFLVDNATNKEYEYPKCLFDGTWEDVWDAAKGHKIDDTTVVPLPAYKYDIISNLTNGIPSLDKLSWNIKITAVEVGGVIVPLRGNGITIELSTNGTLVNGNLDFEHNGTQIQDMVSGQVSFKDGTVNVSSANGQVTGVVFSGYLSNELNLRSVSVRERRSLQKFAVEDGPRWNMPFSIEEIEDAAALMDINYYNRMIDEIVKTQEFIEGKTVIKFLKDEYDKFNGINTDIYNLESLVQYDEVDVQHPASFAGDPFKYISNAIQFKLRSMIFKLTDASKLDKLSFVIVGNPMATQLLSEHTTWKSQQGTSVGGITVNNSYGFMTGDLGAPVRVVSTNQYDAYTDQPVPKTGKKELVLDIYVYPTDPEHISFRHLKYTSHLMTSQSQTAYQSVNAPGGAYNIVTATSRYKDIVVQGIQGRLVLLNSDKIYS